MVYNKVLYVGDDRYVINTIIRGDRLVVEDLYKTNYAYAEDISDDQRYEMRKKGSLIDSFSNLEEVREYLDEGMDDI